MKHLVLLGDSIFDNGAYVAGGPEVVEQLREQLPAGWQATLRAVDGSTTSGVKAQLHRLPRDTSHLVLSAGGNDALGEAGILEQGADSVADALNRLAAIREQFGRSYRAMLGPVLALGLPTAVCTIYDASYPDPQWQRLVVAALALFNDCITREAFARGLPLIDLRLICDRADDYANPIEPSVRGGKKIAAAIARLVAEHDFSRRRSEVFLQPGAG